MNDDERKEFESMRSRMNQHISIYETNRKEDTALFQLMKEQNDIIIKQLEPMVKVFNGSRFTFDFVVSLLKFVGLFGSAIIAIAYLIKLLRGV